MEPININIVQPRDALGIANDSCIAARAGILGFAPEIIANQSQLVLPAEIAGGTRLIKCIFLPLHIKDLINHADKATDDRKAHKRDIHVASTVHYGACVLEDVGLIGLGFAAVKVMALKVLIAIVDWMSTVGLLIQLAFVYSEYKKMKNAEVHLKGIEANDVNYLNDKTRFHSFSDAVGFKRKTVVILMERVIDNSQVENNPSLMNRFIANLKSRVELGILTRKFGIFIAISFAASVIIHLIPPLALVGWGMIGVFAIGSIAYTAYRLVNTYYLNKELIELAALPA